MSFIQIFKNKSIKLFSMLGVLIFSLFGVVSCTSSNNSKYYKSYSFSSVSNWPSFIGGEYHLGSEERVYHFVFSFQDLDDIFYTCTGEKTSDYFSKRLFKKNAVLCIVRDETFGTAEVKYYDFKVNGLQLSIEEEFIDGGAEVVSRYLDFVIIPRSEIPNGELNLGIEYYWKKTNWFFN